MGVGELRHDANRPDTCVIVSYWTGRRPKKLHRLLKQMRQMEAGIPFDLAIVCNGGNEHPLTLPRDFDDLAPRILNRENLGYNLGAWDHGWRNVGGYEYYLFLQDDCFLKNPAWVHDFVFRMSRDENIGLLGEMIMYDQMTWEYVRRAFYHVFHAPREQWPEPSHPIDYYRDLFEAHGIPWNQLATHLPSIILFTSRRILEEVDGFPFLGPTYRQAIASEIAFSQLIASRGYRISKVSDIPFSTIGHPQWSRTGQLRSPEFWDLMFEMRWRAKGLAKNLLGMKRRVRKGTAHVEPSSDFPTSASPSGGCPRQ